MSGSAQGGCSQVACCGWQFLNRVCKERADRSLRWRDASVHALVKGRSNHKAFQGGGD